ncbi:putative secreted protein (Por secretion system target) [Flavobacteriaceae bacterium MAR_2010_72]|nr:putative secreted protein (Por secretion system target) [Flavobacteriaceae bacterium MAR_2010_72]TVZ58664.1 putative secreted protein (Por secretion system target) [Flavobacteriaceae bacterium MAR_2010_105]
MMKSKLILCVVLIFQIQNVASQVVLNADGPGNTYELINSVLAPGYDAVEDPDCNHTAFGRHIDEVFDAELNTNVFRFQIHVSPDNDRCINFDRQRNEIKTYDKSPDNLKGVEGETVIYKWKFKLDAGFQSSPNFTHIHQLKTVGGLYEATPMYTLTARKGTPDRLELRYAEASSQSTLQQTDLAPFKGTWVEVTETIKYGTNTSLDSGTYSIVIKRVSDMATLFSYSNNAIKNWQTDAEFVRPKWGIYRSLINSGDLRDEQVLFADFSIEETGTLSVNDSNFNEKGIRIVPNPASGQVSLIEATPNSYNSINIYDNLGRIIHQINPISKSIDVSYLNSGLYFIRFKKGLHTVHIERLIVK